jgi:hypothetical protein
VQASSARSFLNSLGVNTHNDQGYSAAAYSVPLAYLGVHAIRDGEHNLANIIALHQQTGIVADVFSQGDLSGLLAAGHTLAAAGALLSLEGPNEPNNFPFVYQGALGGGFGPGTTWVPVAQYQRDLYAAVKGDAVLSAYPVFSASETGAETDNVGLQFLTIPSGGGALMPDSTQFADYANPHNYVCSGANIYEDNQAWMAADPALNSIWDGIYGSNAITWAQHFTGYPVSQLAGLPRVTTETGWDSVSGIGGEPVQGYVLVNTYLAQFKRGWTYTFIYELIDGEGSIGNQGLFHADHTPKLAATYIHNLTSVLSDAASNANPGTLNYAIASQPATVHDLLLQKSSGRFELVVWDERAAASDQITVSLGANFAQVNVYDVTVGAAPIQSLPNVGSVTLTLTNHAVIIEPVN